MPTKRGFRTLREARLSPSAPSTRTQKKFKDPAKVLNRAVKKAKPVVPNWEYGTSPSSLGVVKMMSEEAALSMCFNCGYANGRHWSRCPDRGS